MSSKTGAPDPSLESSARTRIPRLIVHLLPALMLLVAADAWLTDGWKGGFFQKDLTALAQRLDSKPNATILLLGSSTSGGWIGARYLGKQWGLPPTAVLDGHANGCLHDCTYAEVRRLLAAKRRFETVFFGVNLYGLCEHPSINRVLQQAMLTPRHDLPDLFSFFLEAENPRQSFVRFGLVHASGAFANRDFARFRIRETFAPASNPETADLWYRPHRNDDGWAPTCDYRDESIRLKRRLTENLLDDLLVLSERVVVMLLPDSSLDRSDPETREAWRRHLSLHRGLTAERPGVLLMDLASNGVQDAAFFTDGFHLNNRGGRAQQRLFERQLDQLKLR